MGNYLKVERILIEKAREIMPDTMSLLINLVQKGGPGDTRSAIGMLFDFDQVFNQKTEELLKYGLGLDSKERREKITSEDLLETYKKTFCQDFS